MDSGTDNPDEGLQPDSVLPGSAASLTPTIAVTIAYYRWLRLQMDKLMICEREFELALTDSQRDSIINKLKWLHQGERHARRAQVVIPHPVHGRYPREHEFLDIIWDIAFGAEFHVAQIARAVTKA